MITRDYISNRLKDLSFNPEILARYDESHRHYHTMDHVIEVLGYLQTHIDCNELFLTAVFHDIIYDPRSKTNEEDSAALFLKEAAGTGISDKSKENIRQMILETAHHRPGSDLSKVFIEADLAILNQSLDKLLTYEEQIFKEYQFVDYKIYKTKRIEVLEHYNQFGRLNTLMDYVRHCKPRIGVFAGSFNPFHKGHYNVLQKAEKIFDKVIIAFGKNPDKNARTWDVPKTIGYRQIEGYDGLLTDFIDSLGYDVTVIRGLRNSTDFQYEQNQYRYIQELMPGIKIVNIFCDKEFEHISSSGIRTLEKYDKHRQYLLP
ncbi:MAG: adenylyltransferase/cytidyltransferase family protein [Bacteroidetes bacterium]|nr:adenylyltransferase/cytidyltransferase family protein [Bacteroidota bacterium]